MAKPSTPEANAAMAQSRGGRRRPVTPQSQRRGRAKPNIDFEVGKRVTHAVSSPTYERKSNDPVYRPLRIYALDPSASIEDGAHSVVNVPYEPLRYDPYGPRGAVLEIVASDGATSTQLNLDDPALLMSQGLPQSPEDPHFQQQMAYAVCMTTYAAFRQALGRDIAWGMDGARGTDGPRLRIRPSVASLPNAFYDRARGELCFGAFAAGNTVAGRNVPNGLVSLCLSHDVVVHEMSHALLDGLRSHFLYPSNPDVLAFHEGFADLIAVFQRFTYRDVVLAAIRSSRGEIPYAKLLTSLAVQFAQATTATGALRSAVGAPERSYEDAIEPHQRGEILVRAVFEAFTTVFNRKTMPLMRLATAGTGILPAGQIPDVLAQQLTERACQLAAQFLSICIRAIDYCPPVDMTFGEFLRAVVTADRDLVPHDEHCYREAWVDAFARYRIYPRDVPSLAEGALLWRSPQSTLPIEPELSFAELKFNGDPGRAASADELERQAQAFGQLAADPEYRHEFGLAGADDPELEGDVLHLPVVESVRPSRRVGPNGQVVFDLIAEVTQRREVRPRGGQPGFNFYGGATAILDPKGLVRFVIRKSVLDAGRLRRQRDFIEGMGRRLFASGPSKFLLPQSKLLLKLHDTTRPQSQPAATARKILTASESGSADETPRLFLREGNDHPLVTLLKSCLNDCLEPPPHLDASPLFDLDTERAVIELQSRAEIIVDGIVGPFTWTVIGRELRAKGRTPSLGNAPEWMRSLILNDIATVKLRDLDVRRALEIYQFGYGKLGTAQRAGFDVLLNKLAADAEIIDTRWAAYMLATVKHECADQWQPIEEYGKGKDRKYGKPEAVTDPATGLVRENRYYGRGYVQLTWRDNYKKLGNELGLGDALEIEPDLALDPDIAYRIMSIGMRRGLFTKKRLEQYINAGGADYRGARRIINGTDQADRIAGYALEMETVLLASIPAKAELAN